MFTNKVLDVINYCFKSPFLMEDKATLIWLEALGKSWLNQCSNWLLKNLWFKILWLFLFCWPTPLFIAPYSLPGLQWSLSSILPFYQYGYTILNFNVHSVSFFLHKTARPHSIDLLPVLPLPSHFSMIWTVYLELLQKTFRKNDWKASYKKQNLAYL